MNCKHKDTIDVGDDDRGSDLYCTKCGKGNWHNRRLNTYILYIKSHCEASDYEDEVDAHNKKEALKYFTKRINQGSEDYWDESMVESQMARIYKNGKTK